MSHRHRFNQRYLKHLVDNCHQWRTAIPERLIMVVVGDASYTEPQMVQGNPANVLFTANMIDWLAQDEALINIRSKNRTPPSLVFESDASRNLLKWGNLLGVPALFVLLGFVRVTGRRRRAEGRWREVVS